MKHNRNQLWLIFGGFVFLVVGMICIFFIGNTNKYDSKTKAYKIDPNLDYDRTEPGKKLYYPKYYFTVDGTEYVCETEKGSSIDPDEKKNTVYYDSKNPNNCLIEYEKSTSTLAGIICLVTASVLLGVGFFKFFKQK